MPTQCRQEELDFGRSGGRKLVGAFDGGAITSNGGSVLQCSVRGRDGRCRPPPAQIRAGPIRALGSYLGCLTAKRTLGHG